MQQDDTITRVRLENTHNTSENGNYESEFLINACQDGNYEPENF